MTALLTDEEIVAESIIFSVNMRETVNAEEPTRMQAFEVGVSARSFSDGARFARSIYEARLAEAILLMKEAAPAIDTISSGLSERFDRFLAIYTKEDKP